MSFEMIQNMLGEGLRSINQVWGEVSNDWDDDVRRQFEQEFWEDYERTIVSAINEMAQFSQLYNSAQRSFKK